jgi:hypothetical protein
MFTKQQINAVYAARRDRLVHPRGNFDKQGRWYPSDAENADGYAGSLRTPSKAWPYSYLTGARTLKHVKGLATANPALFEQLVAEAEAALSRVAA